MTIISESIRGRQVAIWSGIEKGSTNLTYDEVEFEN